MQLTENDEKKDIKPHWKAGAVVLVLVVLIASVMMMRGRGGSSPAADGLVDPSQFGDAAATTEEAATAGKIAPPDLTANNCEDPLTKCTNNCDVEPAEVGACDWQLVGGSTATPAEAVKTFALGLQKIQAQTERAEEEVDQAYQFDQFINFYKKTIGRSERGSLQNIRATTLDPFQQKAVDILLKDD